MTEMRHSVEIAKNCIKTLGDLFYANDKLCTHIVTIKKEELGLVKTLQSLMCKKEDKLRNASLWIISNIILNSKADREVVIASGILTNVALACRGFKPTV